MNDQRQSRRHEPLHYAALADTPRVMEETLDTLADLHDTTMAMGKAVVAAGLPRRVWRTEQAALRPLANALPDITVGAFLARLERFATRDGPTWLRGNQHDLEAFH